MLEHTAQAILSSFSTKYVIRLLGPWAVVVLGQTASALQNILTGTAHTKARYMGAVTFKKYIFPLWNVYVLEISSHIWHQMSEISFKKYTCSLCFPLCEVCVFNITSLT